MLLFLKIIYGILCVLTIGIVLLQRSEDGAGGMFGGGGGGDNALFGTKTNTVLTKVTTVFGILMFVLIIVLSKMSASAPDISEDIDKINAAVKVEEPADKDGSAAKDGAEDAGDAKEAGEGAAKDAAKEAGDAAEAVKAEATKAADTVAKEADKATTEVKKEAEKAAPAAEPAK